LADTCAAPVRIRTQHPRHSVRFVRRQRVQEVITLYELQAVSKSQSRVVDKAGYTPRKTCVFARGAYFEFKKVTCLPRVSSICNTVGPTPFGPHSLRCSGTVHFVTRTACRPAGRPRRLFVTTQSDPDQRRGNPNLDHQLGW
jgi:hypothetical protein